MVRRQSGSRGLLILIWIGSNIQCKGFELSQWHCVFVVHTGIEPCAFEKKWVFLKKSIKLGNVWKYSEWLASLILVTEVVTLELPHGGCQTESFSSHQESFTSLQRWFLGRRKKKRPLDSWFWEVVLESTSSFHCCCQVLPALSGFSGSPPDLWERQVSSRHWNRKWCCDSCG